MASRWLAIGGYVELPSLELASYRKPNSALPDFLRISVFSAASPSPSPSVQQLTPLVCAAPIEFLSCSEQKIAVFGKSYGHLYLTNGVDLCVQISLHDNSFVSPLIPVSR